MGFPFALNIKDVIPIIDAVSVKKFSLSKIQNASADNETDTLQIIISSFEK